MASWTQVGRAGHRKQKFRLRKLRDSGLLARRWDRWGTGFGVTPSEKFRICLSLGLEAAGRASERCELGDFYLKPCTTCAPRVHQVGMTLARD